MSRAPATTPRMDGTLSLPGLRPWTEVADALAERTGQRISPSRCQQIAREAERKIAFQMRKERDAFPRAT